MSNYLRLAFVILLSAVVATLVRGFLPKDAPAPTVIEVEKPLRPDFKPLSSIGKEDEEPQRVWMVARMRLDGVWIVHLSDGRILRTDAPRYDGLQEINRRWVRVDGVTYDLKPHRF